MTGLAEELPVATETGQLRSHPSGFRPLPPLAACPVSGGNGKVSSPSVSDGVIRPLLDRRYSRTRPNPDRHRKNARKSAIELLRPIHLADLRMLPAQQLEIYTCDSGNR